jgi:Protein of unknown function (DUF2442)
VRVTPRLLEAKVTEGCCIWLRFEDGIAAEVDFSYLLDYDGVFVPLRDPEYFREVAIYPGGATIFWPGEVDIAPETVYLRVQEAAGVAS